MKVKAIIKLMRPKHYIKNLLLFVPIVFSGNFFHANKLVRVFAGFVVFSALASVVYIFNDIHDANEDRQHPVKKFRPIASGQVSTGEGYGLAGLLLIFALAIHLSVFGKDWKCMAVCASYLIVNFSYSFGLKNIPFVDIALLVSGFFLRVLYGAVIIDVGLSNWVCLTVISLSIYLGLGKRRNELIKNRGAGNTRRVLKYYTTAFCSQFMNSCMTCAMIFYALWSTDAETISKTGSKYLIFTVPVVFFVLMKYCADIEGDSYGDPVDVVLHDKLLIGLCMVFAIMILSIIYAPEIGGLV